MSPQLEPIAPSPSDVASTSPKSPVDLPPWNPLNLSSPQPPPPNPPRIPLPPPRAEHPPHPASSSSVSSPSAPDSDAAAALDVDDLLDGIDRARIDDLWQTPRQAAAPPRSHTTHHSQQPPHHHQMHGLHHSKHHYPFQHHVHSHHLQHPHQLAQPPPTHALPHKHVVHHHVHPYAAIFAPPPGGKSFASVESKMLAHAHARARDEDVSSLVTRPEESTSCDSDRLDSLLLSVVDPADFPRLYKVHPCPSPATCYAANDPAECFYYHCAATDRRRANVASYKPHMCRFVEDAAGCRKADRCPFAHNDFERRYHPDRFGKETCRDFLRGDCPRRYCTFRHHVARKVQVALEQIDEMADKEMLQLVLKIGEERGRALCDKLLRRFGHGKKHSGWRLEGFARGREGQKVKHVTARVEAVKRRLKGAGEKKWAASLKTCSLRDMMSGVRKVAEEMRERCRADETYVENGASEVHRLIRAVFSNTNWSCHSQEGDNPFLVTPENQNDAVSALERLVDEVVDSGRFVGKEGATTTTGSTMGAVGDVVTTWALPAAVGQESAQQ